MLSLLALPFLVASIPASFLVAFYAGPRVWQVPIPILKTVKPLRISGFGISLTILVSAFLIGTIALESIKTHENPDHRKTAERADR